MKIGFLTIVGIVCASFSMNSLTHAAELPASTKAQLKKLKLDEAIMAGLDQELAMPQAWFEGAKVIRRLRNG